MPNTATKQSGRSLIALEGLIWNDWTWYACFCHSHAARLFEKNLDVHLVFPRQKKKLNVLKSIFSRVKTLVLSSAKCGNAILTWHPLNDLCLFYKKSGICSILKHFQKHTVGVLLGLLM